jgi:hypothetical protein
MSALYSEKGRWWHRSTKRGPPSLHQTAVVLEFAVARHFSFAVVVPQGAMKNLYRFAAFVRSRSAASVDSTKWSR